MTRAKIQPTYPLIHRASTPTLQAYLRMNTAEDDDLKLLRASASHLSDLEKLITRLVRKRRNESTQIRSQVRVTDLGRVQALVCTHATRGI